jgi:origin recognition complex subunit 2
MDNIEDDPSESASDGSDVDGNAQTNAGQTKLIVGTAFDAYFLQSLPAPRTSANVFSTLVQPLTSDEYSAALPPEIPSFKYSIPSNWAETYHRPSFGRFARELEEGFNLLFYGLGSKRAILNRFASDFCSKRGHVVIANSFQPNFSLKELLSSIERVPGIQNLPLPSSNIEKQARRIYDFFALFPAKHRLFIVIHNIDAPIFRTTKAKSCLLLLALNPHIHLVASVDRINAPLLWSSTELSARKQEIDLGGDVSRRGYAWLWHDLTTLSPYDIELCHADHSSISGASVVHKGAARNQQETGGVTPVNGTLMTETAAQHILASVTLKAKRLFAVLGTRQIQSMDDISDAAGANAQQYALGYDILFSVARDNFIATNDTAIRSLLGEFKDHGLVMSAAQGSGPGSGEVLWIPLRKERLVRILKSLDTEQ